VVGRRQHHQFADVTAVQVAVLQVTTRRQAAGAERHDVQPGNLDAGARVACQDLREAFAQQAGLRQHSAFRGSRGRGVVGQIRVKPLAGQVSGQRLQGGLSVGQAVHQHDGRPVYGNLHRHRERRAVRVGEDERDQVAYPLGHGRAPRVRGQRQRIAYHVQIGRRHIDELRAPQGIQDDRAGLQRLARRSLQPTVRGGLHLDRAWPAGHFEQAGQRGGAVCRHTSVGAAGRGVAFKAQAGDDDRHLDETLGTQRPHSVAVPADARRVVRDGAQQRAGIPSGAFHRRGGGLQALDDHTLARRRLPVGAPQRDE